MLNKSVVRTLCLLGASAWSVSGFTMSLEQAWKAAQQYNPSYQKAQIGVEVSQNAFTANRSALLPSLDASTSSNWSDSRSGSTNSYNVSLSQTIWDSSLWANLDQSQAQQVVAQLQLTQAYNQLAQELIHAYLEMARAQSDVALAQSKLDEGKKLLAMTEQRYKAGRVKSIDVEDMRANHLSEKMALLTAQTDLEKKRSALQALTNQNPIKVAQVVINIVAEPPMLVESQQEWLNLAKNTSPELLAAIQKVSAKQYAKEAAQGGYFPKVKGTVGYSDDDRFSNGDTTAGISVSIPIDINGSIRAKVDSAALDVRSAEQEVRETEIGLRDKVQQQFVQIKHSWQLVRSAGELSGYRQKVLQGKQSLYQAGRVQASELIDAHNNVFTARNDLQHNLYQYWSERVNLLQSAGKLDDDAISRISGALSL